MTNRLPAEELLSVIRITQAERRADANPRREPETERPAAVVRLPSDAIVRGLREPARRWGASWLPVPRG